MLDTETIQKMAENSGEISGTMIILIVFCGIWAFERIYKLTAARKNGVPTWKDVNNKVTKEECKSFKTRIGNESYQHTRDISSIKEGISSIKEDVAFMRGKMED